MKGGTHVAAVADDVANKLLEKIKKKEKSCKNLKVAHVKNHLWVFVSALIENPAFDSQTKETLNTRASNFGSKFVASESVIKKMMNSGIVENILAGFNSKQSAQLKKQDGAKKTRLTAGRRRQPTNRSVCSHLPQFERLSTRPCEYTNI